MQRTLPPYWLIGGLLWAASASPAWSGAPTAEQALQLAPIQKDVDFDRPTGEDAARSTIAAEEINKHVGWVVSGPAGTTLRKFVDTNGDKVVDQRCYFKDGIEVYRDIDSDFDGNIDQSRWLNTAGSRWGLDQDEDGVIDAWKTISAEEATAEVVAALAARDLKRFQRVALSASDVPALGLGSEKAQQLAKKIEKLQAGFQETVAGQREIGPGSRWLQFSGTHPGTVPAGTDGSNKDLRVYENVMALVQNGEETSQVLIGTMVQLGDVWKVIDVPQPISGGDTELSAVGFFFRGETPEHTAPAASGPSEQTQSLLGDLEKLDAATENASSPAELARLNAQRADLIERIADQSDKPEDRAMWLRQLADTVSAAVQSGGYPAGAMRLEQLFEKLKKNPADGQLAAYVRFRQLTGEYGLAVQNNTSPADFVKIQEEWLAKLEQYANDYPDSPDSAEAMLQLGIAQEFAGEEEEAKRWYGRVVAAFPKAPQAAKAAGARTRLDSIGKVISFRGQSPSGAAVDLAGFRGKVVLIQFWATWCEPCKADMPTLRELTAKYGSSGLAIIGVNLDSSAQEMSAYLSENRMPWPQIREEGGLDSRPANELGILTLPTMILVDQQGRVVNRNVQAAELESEIRKLLQ